METAGIRAASWVVGKALSPLSDGLVEAWAASSELAPNIEAIKTELLYAQAMLINARGREIHNAALAELLQKLRGLAYTAEDVLDELDYFRIQDELEGTFETVDRGCFHNLLRDARHTTKAAATKLGCISASSKTTQHGSSSSSSWAWPCAGAQEELCEGVHRLTYRARGTVRSVGKLVSSLLPVHDDDGGTKNDNGDDSGSDDSKVSSATQKTIEKQPCKCMRQLTHPARSIVRFVSKQTICTSVCTRTWKWKKQSHKTPKLDFDRVDVSRRMRQTVEQLQSICAKVSTILDLELLGSAIVKLEFMGSRSGIGNATTTSRSTTTSESVEPKLFGRDSEKDAIVENITKGVHCHQDLNVLPIVGPGGIGKTTLTQYIYNNEEVQDHFQIRVWVCVSLHFDVYRLTKEICDSIPRVEDDEDREGVQNLDKLQKLIGNRIKNKRFLLVLDDIWKCSDVDWKTLLIPFTKGLVKGNIILVTTRLIDVAQMVTTVNEVTRLDRLNPEEFWSFFMACVFGHSETRQHQEDSDLIKTGKLIAEKLKGSPLAAKTVGRLLRNNLTLDHWTRVLQSKEWDSQTNDYDIMPALKLSYDYLPFHLQQCFSYCALFPEDHRFDSEDLICFWIGLEILHPGHPSKRIEDIGLDHLNDLVNYGFFKKEINEEGRAYYVMHDLLHDLALKVSSQECMHIDSSSSTPMEVPSSIYHLSISLSPANSEDETTRGNLKNKLAKIGSRLKPEKLRTLMVFGRYDQRYLVTTLSDVFKDAKSLRVVRLSTMSHPVESILYNFSKLVHLRYIKLESGYSNESHLPASLSRFYHLRVLDIQEWRGARILPNDMANLSKLRHFLICYTEFHSDISNVGKLHSLQELTEFRVKNQSNGFELKELGELAELGGSLSITNLENVQVNEAHEAMLLHKKHLRKLALNWEHRQCDQNSATEDQVLENLQPHINLSELEINKHGGSTCPTWLGENLRVKGLEVLRLDGTGWNKLPPLGEMWLTDGSGQEYFGCIIGKYFKNLKKLELKGLPNLVKWVAKEVCPMFFSLMEVLIVTDCDKLIELPFSYCTYCTSEGEGDGGATWFPRLKEVRIRNCPKLLSLPPLPYTRTVSSVDIEDAGTSFRKLHYDNTACTLTIEGENDRDVLYDKALAFPNLTQLQQLTIKDCSPLAVRYLQMLTSLKTLQLVGSSIVFMPSESRSNVEPQLPVEYLIIGGYHGSAKELTQLLSHLPKLSKLNLIKCDKIARLAVAIEEQQTTGAELEDTQAIGCNQQEQITEDVDQEDEDGLLLFPTHLFNSLRTLVIRRCEELTLLPHPLGVGHREAAETRGQGLQGLRSLESLEITESPKFLSAYNGSSFSTPFPSSLKRLQLEGRMKGAKRLDFLSNLTSLTRLDVYSCKDLRCCKGLWPLLTQGQLSELEVLGAPRFFAGLDPILRARGVQDEQEQEQQLILGRGSIKLQDLCTDDLASVLVKPICSLLSSSLTSLTFEVGYYSKDITPSSQSHDQVGVECFTKDQEEALQLLTHLNILGFANFTKLRCLPSGLHRLANLKTLVIYGCPSIRSLPKNGLPSGLQRLNVRDCGNDRLKQQCSKLKGTIAVY